MRAGTASRPVLVLVVACVAAACASPAAPPPPPLIEAQSAEVAAAPLESEFADWDAAPTAVRWRAAMEIAARLDGLSFVRMATFACGVEQHETAVFRHRATGLEFVMVPAGFRPDGRDDHWDRDAMDHLSAYLVARTEVPLGVWRRAGAGGAATDPSPAKEDDLLPAARMTFDEAAALCATQGLALPTEAQWAAACRGGARTRFCCGDAEVSLDEYAWTDANSGGEPGRVASRKPNALGIYDMHGNVREWCSDACRPGGPCRVARGQYFDGDVWSDRAAYRARFTSPYLGFRPVALVPVARGGGPAPVVEAPAVR